MKGQVDRDRSVGRLLDQALRPGAESVSTVPCPDAETLAAWIGGGLGTAQQTRTETHVADCARCQAQLAAMARMPSALPSSVPSWTLNRVLAWLAPLAVGAVAVAILVWVQRATPQQGLARPQSDVARQQTPQLPVTTSPAVAPPVASGALADRFLGHAEAPSGAGRPSGPTSKTSRDRSRVDAAGARKEGRLSPESSPSAPARAQSDRAAAALIGSAASGPPPPEPGKPAFAPSAAANELARARTFAAQVNVSIVEIASPDPAIRWRITQGTLVQRSTDAGSTWEIQSTGNAAQLIAGASPAPSVCWLVGRAAVVLLTTDGRSWHRLKFPEAVDLMAVRATDADTASVTVADGRVFTTQDGGNTWTTPPPNEFSPLQESSANPF